MASSHCVDTSSFIALKYYPRDLFSSLWAFIEEMISTGQMIAPHEVLRELSKQDDDVYKWAKTQKGAFLPLDAEQGAVLTEVLDKFPALAEAMRLKPHADPMVVGLALLRTRKEPESPCDVVTEEKMRGDGSHKVPNVCKHFGLKSGTLLDVFRTAGIRFEIQR